MIINLSCVSVDNHIPLDDIFDYLPLRCIKPADVIFGTKTFLWDKFYTNNNLELLYGIFSNNLKNLRTDLDFCSQIKTA